MSHAPSHRLVPRKQTGPLPEHDLFHQPVDDATIQARFEQWLREQPDVLSDFVELARQARDAGRRRVGAKAIAEAMRWQGYLRHGDGYRLNNVFVSRLARRAVETAPDLTGMFEFRELRAS